MQIQIDSREKAKAIKGIIKEFDRQEIPYFTSKLYVADYMNLLNPLVFIDRKQNIAEIAQNAISGHKRFKAELERMDGIGAKMYILIEQDKIDKKPITCLEDIILWENKHGAIQGDRIYRILKVWERKHNIEYVFCNKRNTGKMIIKLLEKR
ncbi:ERCC4 domain-containing protein [Anaerovorax odorimutans]|uniref:ERCC4 domain-containing protein n=1 Tax=Anaerovorax odorimutans TaxID=109327 RepID=UPI00041FA5FC|nr:ERCC4 domain-containing protein [Anaerovorax odorimutans]